MNEQGYFGKKIEGLKDLSGIYKKVGLFLVFPIVALGTIESVVLGNEVISGKVISDSRPVDIPGNNWDYKFAIPGKNLHIASDKNTLLKIDDAVNPGADISLLNYSIEEGYITNGTIKIMTKYGSKSFDF